MTALPLVLLVDDTAVMRQVYGDILDQHGFLVCTASDGFEALDVAIAQRPDIIVMDFRMPGLDGIEAARRLKADPRTSAIPIILFTGETIGEEARKAGCDAIVPKPCRSDLLLAVVRAQLPRP